MTDQKAQLFQYLRENKGAELAQLAEGLGVSPDFILGMVESNGLYRIEGEFVTIAGLGTDRCIVCAEDRMNEHNSVKVRLPQDSLDDRRLKGISEIRGHRRCYTEIDIFFRYQEGLSCWDCSSWSGAWVDGNEVEERCSRLGVTYSGHQGVIGADRMCNFFSPDHNMKTDDDNQWKRDKWERIKPEIEQRTQAGYKNLVSLLEKARLTE